MDGGTVTGIIQCCLAVVAIGVDIVIAAIGGQFVKARKNKREEEKASNAIDENINASIDNATVAEQNSIVLLPDKKLKRQAKDIFSKLKKKHKNTYPKISAISLVIALKKLYDGNERLVVRGLNIAKQKSYLDWSGEKLLPSTIITINVNKENELIDYLGSRKS